jgi:hypothetical protein
MEHPLGRDFPLDHADRIARHMLAEAIGAGRNDHSIGPDLHVGAYLAIFAYEKWTIAPNTDQ